LYTATIAKLHAVFREYSLKLPVRNPHIILTLAAIAIFTTPSITVAAPPVAIEAEGANQAMIQQLVERFKPSLVRIHVVEGSPSEGREVKSQSFGSGVIISPDGYVVTNHHVAGNARWLSVTLSNKEQVEAKLIGTDALSDIAVIKLAPPASGTYTAASWGDSSKLRVGEAVLAMGSPLAFSQSVTAGIVSNTELIMPGAASMMLDGEDVGSIVRWIGHDAQIFPGNSGGPLVNLRGEIIGINEISFGLAGAIPGNLAREVSELLVKDGKVQRAYFGLDLQPRLRGDKRESGVLVSGVLRSSPATRAGIRAGDLLLKIGDARLDARFSEQLPLVNLELSRLPVDKPVAVTLHRGGAEQEVTLVPESRALAESPSLEVKGMGITGCNITPWLAQELALPNSNGVWVTSVATGAPAADADPAVTEGDVILSLGGKPVNSIADLIKIAGAVPRKAEGVPTLVEVRRDNERVLTVVDINRQNDEDTSVEVARPYLPVSTQVVTETLAKALKLPAGTMGVRITHVHPNSAAEKGGLRVGDVITKLDGLEVDASQPEETDIFPSMIRQYKIGSKAKLTVLRPNGKTTPAPAIITITLPRAPKQERELAKYSDENFGLTIRSITYLDRLRKAANPGETGVMVLGVDNGSWAELAAFASGDIIRSIGGVAVTDMESARTRLKALEKERSKHVVFFVSRGIHTLFIEVQTDWSLPPVKADEPKKTDAAVTEKSAQ